MNYRTAIFLPMLAFAVFMPAPFQPALAASAGIDVQVAASTIELMAAKKDKTKKRAKARYVRRMDAPVHRGWRGSDPSFDENGRPYPGPHPSLGACVQDLGYGRWGACPNW